jgi:riboflavin kinase/FMN adenylyltransferase
MRVFRSIAEVGAALRGCAVAIGNFDGVHLGHQALFQRARALAVARGGPAVALTFDPHPVRVLRPQVAPPTITPLPRKLELLEASGLDAVVVQPFTLEYAKTSAEEFAARDLDGGLGAAHVVVGHDFTAGHERARVDRLGPILGARRIALQLVAPVAAEGLVASSTKIREFLLEGNVEAAEQLLTRPHDVDGVVERGAGLGRTLGFATANVRAEAMLPANGVYVVRAWVGGDRAGGPGSERYGGVCNVGVKPTLQASGPVIPEVHLFDHSGEDLYGGVIRVAFLSRLREERRFPSLDALRAQIAEDAAAARELLRHAPPM